MSTPLAALILVAGSYGSADTPTFHSYRFDPNDGSVQLIEALAGMENPSYLAVTDGGATILAVNENNGAESTMTMLRGNPALGHWDTTAKVALGDDGPCHVAVSPDGKYAVTANYTNGSVSIVPFDGAKGEFGETVTVKFTGSGLDSKRQATPHAHFTSFTPDDRLMIVDDLGTDRLHTFRMNSDGTPDTASMVDIVMAPGSGPRHLVFDRRGANAYLINELDGNVVRLAYDPEALTLTPLQSIHADYEDGRGSADIHLSPDGRFLYVSNRIKGDGIAVFAVDPATGDLSPAGFTPTGKHPRNFIISPDGGYLLVACRDDNSIEIYKRDNKTGQLSRVGAPVSCPRPVCLKFI